MWFQITLPAGEADPQVVADTFDMLGHFPSPCRMPPTSRCSSRHGRDPPLVASPRDGLVRSRRDITRINAVLAQRFGAACAERLHIETLDDRDWCVRGWTVMRRCSSAPNSGCADGIRRA